MSKEFMATANGFSSGVFACIAVMALSRGEIWEGMAAGAVSLLLSFVSLCVAPNHKLKS